MSSSVIRFTIWTLYTRLTTRNRPRFVHLSSIYLEGKILTCKQHLATAEHVTRLIICSCGEPCQGVAISCSSSPDGASSASSDGDQWTMYVRILDAVLDETYAWRSICHSPKIQDAPRIVAMRPYSLTSIVQRRLCQPDVAFATTGGPPAGHPRRECPRPTRSLCVGNIRVFLGRASLKSSYCSIQHLISISRHYLPQNFRPSLNYELVVPRITEKLIPCTNYFT